MSTSSHIIGLMNRAIRVCEKIPKIDTYTDYLGLITLSFLQLNAVISKSEYADYVGQ